MQIRRSIRFLEILGNFVPQFPEKKVLRGWLVNSILWQEVKSVAGPEYARPTTGVSITRGNNGNGALPTREPPHGEDQDNAEQ